MLQKIFAFVSLIKFSFLMILPLNKNEIGLNNDDMFYYIKVQNEHQYVKAGDKGYFCYKSENIWFFQEYIPSFKKYKEECNTSNICETNLECRNNIYLGIEGQSPSIYSDPFSNKELYYCSDDTFTITTTIIDSGETIINNKCEKNEEMKGKCYIRSNSQKFVSSDYMKVCGKVEASNNDISSILISDI